MDCNEVGARTIPTTHLRLLIDDTGIFQHCNGHVPSWQHGYCLDDVARAMIVMSALEEFGDRTWSTELIRCASFVDAAIDGPMTAYNFLRFDRTWDGSSSDGDHVGRAIWALGELCVADDQLGGWAAHTACRLIDGDRLVAAPLMTRVFALLGVSRLAAQHDLDDLMTRMCTSLAADVDSASDWPWPDRRLRYDAARIPQALIECGSWLSRAEIADCGVRLLAWLDNMMATRPLRVVGHRGLGPQERLEESGDEQPVEIAALAAAHAAAERVTGDAVHRSRIDECLAWFHGVNRLGVVMIDPTTGAGHDGLGELGRNSNQGAESTLAYLMTALSAWRSAGEKSKGVDSVVHPTEK